MIILLDSSVLYSVYLGNRYIHFSDYFASLSVTVSFFDDELLDFESVTKFMRSNELEEIGSLHNFVPFQRTITIDGGISIELAAVCA
jgi:hypothetical protein